MENNSQNHDPSSAEVSKNVASALLKAGAFKISLDPLFTWTSGIKSPVYCDLRALISDVEARNLILSAFCQLVPSDCEVIAGTATAGIPWAAWIANKLGKPMIYVRGEAKEHGTKKRIEGMLVAGQKVALIEDHISTGKSSVSAVKALREEGGAVVESLLAINTYELTAADAAFESAGVKIGTITNYSKILQVAKGQGVIDETKEKLLADFRSDPAGWAGRNGL